MSSNLYWRPVKPTKGRDLPTELKFTLRKRFGGPVQGILDSGNINYLQGLVDAGVDGADRLLKAVETYGSIEIWEEY